MNPVIIDHRIEKEREGTYYGVPFEVPTGVEQVTVRYRYSREGIPASVVDLGLSDGKGRFLGWSGGARSEVAVGPYSSTPGYWMTEVTPGTWNILVGAYKIPAEGLTVHYEVSFASPGPRWLAGDLHMHSTASDGEHPAYVLAHRAKKEGLDFIAIADHNNYCENFHLPVVPGLTMLPAVEWTHYRGHVNFFGVRAPFENSFIANSEEEMLSLVRQVKLNGALVSVNHPKCPMCPCVWQDETFFDMIEIWNGPMRKANLDAVRWWHNLLCGGRKIPFVGGSDFHRDKSPVQLAHPTTFVYADSPAAEDIQKALAQGRSYITSSVRGVRLGVETDKVVFGDTVQSSPGRIWNFTAKNGKPGMELWLVTDRGVVARAKFHKGTAALRAEEGAWRFAYLKAGYPLKRSLFIRAISNPVYFE